MRERERVAGKCGGGYSLGNRKEGAGGRRGRGAGMRERKRGAGEVWGSI